MMEGIPKFPAVTEEEDAYMNIDGEWTVQRNFSLTYTITVDELRRQNYDPPRKNTIEFHQLNPSRYFQIMN